MKMEVDAICRKLASRIAKEEGGKSQAKIGDIRQILKKLAAMAFETPELLDYIYTWGELQSHPENKPKKKASKK